VQAGVLRALPANVEPRDTDFWILTAPLGVAGQQIQLSLPTAIHVAKEINAFREAFEMQEEWPAADPLSLGEYSVLMILQIVGELRADLNDGADEL
jgi:hypothetical protein